MKNNLFDLALPLTRLNTHTHTKARISNHVTKSICAELTTTALLCVICNNVTQLYFSAPMTNQALEGLVTLFTFFSYKRYTG